MADGQKQESDTAAVDDLQTKESQEMLQLVDELMSVGLDSIIPLPQIVACGDQSSGKSSVLEALTEVPFPRKDTLCTRFATEIVLRPAQDHQIKAHITAHESCPTTHIAALKNFTPSADGIEELGSIMEGAAKLMGLPDLEVEDDSDQPTDGLRAFSRHKLTIEISGPGRPQLTIVDLPGLVHTGTSRHTAEDVTFSQELTSEYTKNPRTIILAVMNGSSEYSLQNILSEVRKVDPDHQRTLGIITRLDCALAVGEQGKVRDYVRLAQNKDKANSFALGWHVVKNRSAAESELSFADRNEREKVFFQGDDFKTLLSDHVGALALRAQVAKVRDNHLRKELPQVRRDVEQKLKQNLQRLSQLGEKTELPEARRKRLMKISHQFEKIVRSAVNGTLSEDDFFNFETFPGDANGDAAGMDDSHLRANLRDSKQQFATQIRQYGHKYSFPQMNDVVGVNLRGTHEVQLSQYYAKVVERQTTGTQTEAITWVKSWLNKTRGRALPGGYDPNLISLLFQRQCSNWKELADRHVDAVDEIIYNFVDKVLHHITSDSVNEGLLQYTTAKLNARREHALEEVKKKMAVVKQAATTCDAHFLRKANRIKSEREAKELVSIATKSSKDEIDLTVDDDSSLAKEATDAMLAYYEEMLEYFIRAIVKEVIEQNMVEGLVEQILSPMIVNEMPEDDMAKIMEERNDVAEERSLLEKENAILLKAQEKLKDVGLTRKRRRVTADASFIKGESPASKRRGHS